jgi:hypothetical protein
MIGMINQYLNLPGGYALNTANDPVPGGQLSTSIGIPGQLGQMAMLDVQKALAHSDTTIGTLYQGIYQYVKAVTALAKGDVVAWDTNANNGLGDFEVTHTITLPMEGFLAGFALNTVTSGNYCWIQVAGLATAKCAASVTTTTVGTIAVQLTTTATVDSIADATGSWIGGGALGLKNIVGTWYEAPANGGLKKLFIKNIGLNPGGGY